MADQKQLVITVTAAGIDLAFHNLTYPEALGVIEYAKMYLRDSAMLQGRAVLTPGELSDDPFKGIEFPIVDGPKDGN